MKDQPIILGEASVSECGGCGKRPPYCRCEATDRRPLKARCPDCLKLLPECKCAANAKRGLEVSRNRPAEQECGRCRGSGFVMARNEYFQSAPQTCGRCGGAGRIAVKPRRETNS